MPTMNAGRLSGERWIRWVSNVCLHVQYEYVFSWPQFFQGDTQSERENNLHFACLYFLLHIWDIYFGKNCGKFSKLKEKIHVFQSKYQWKKVSFFVSCVSIRIDGRFYFLIRLSLYVRERKSLLSPRSFNFLSFGAIKIFWTFFCPSQN